jgi:nitroimidazol reductase NimA-like FMN-containing flavoprotein (pyridoxamine 5'-phosphate oxidase superfamily)
VFETTEELASLDALLAESFGRAGDHLTSIISDDRRLSAADLSRYLVGVRHLVVATVTSDGEPRCSAVDGLFLHGHFWFSTSAQSIKARHLERRPAISGAHVVGDDVAVFVHGDARMVHGGPGEADAIRHFWTEVYDTSPEDWVPTPRDARYVEIVPSSIFSYAFSRERFEAMCDQTSTEADST